MANEPLKERLAKRRKKLKERGQGSGVFFIKEGKTRIRVLPIKDDEDWAFEMTHFYLGAVVKGVFSRSTIGEDCPIIELYEKWKNSSDSTDKDKAKRITPRSKYLVPAILYKDERGKELDEERGITLVMLPTTVYGQMLDAYLDPDLGDHTNPETGYDIKITRTGTGKTDTEYSMGAMRPSVLPKKWATPIDLEELILKKALLSAEGVQDKLDEYLALEGEEEGETKLSLKERKARKKRQGKKGDV